MADALNLGLAAARGPLVARMDADDEALPDRLERQFLALEAQPGLAVLGCGVETIDAEGRTLGSYVPSCDPTVIREGLLQGNHMIHPTVLMRRDIVLAAGGYRPIFRAAEDYDLWLRLSDSHDLGNIPDRLLRYRLHTAQVSAQRAATQRLEALAAQQAARARRAGQPDPLAGRVPADPAVLRSIGVAKAAIRAAQNGEAVDATPRRAPLLLRPIQPLLRAALRRMQARDALDPDGAAFAAARRQGEQGRSRIFVFMPAYRDPECQWTIRDAFEKARHPDRLAVSVVWQVDPVEDLHCFHVRTRPEQVRELFFRHDEARGCSWARNQAMRHWQGEEYALQIDSHMRFVPDWDERMIEELAACPSPRPLLTCRPPHYDPPDELGEPYITLMSVHQFDSHGLLQYTAAAIPPELPQGVPLPTAGCGGGFIFGAASRFLDAPFDPHVYFNGEEMNLAVRLWTAGWDLFVPSRVLIYHHYAHKTPRRHSWSEVRRSQRLDRRTVARLHHLLGVQPTRNPAALLDLHRYGLGRARTLAEYEAFAGVNFRTRQIEEPARQGLFGTARPGT